MAGFLRVKRVKSKSKYIRVLKRATGS